MIYLDTHVLVWLYAGRTDLLPAAARALIDDNDLRISPIVGLELQYLYETDRTSEESSPVLRALEREIGLLRCEKPFAEVVEAAEAESWTRDPFDRLIVAHSKVGRAPLLTRDRTIRAHHREAVWPEH